MSDTSIRRIAARRRPAGSINSMTSRFSQWLNVRDEGAVLKERQEMLRDEILTSVQSNGEPDDKGNVWIDLPEPVSFKDHKGKVFKYSHLKSELHMIPAVPTPDPDKAEDLLKKKKLWLTKEQQKTIQDLQIACPFVKLSIDVDLNAFAHLLFIEKITDAEYESTLIEQKPSYQFRPSE